MCRLNIILFSIIFCSCAVKKETNLDLKQEEQFVSFYADLMVLQEEYRLSRTDSATSRHRIDSLYEAYMIDSVKVQTKLEFYRQDINRWKEFHYNLAKRLETIQRDELSKPSP